ncbi:MAG: FlgB family protein [Pelagimonas sp.]|jgi:flagellar basal-body rod protein FlgB|nr:FlgB family protein [Pelagimonas sp.]
MFQNLDIFRTAMAMAQHAGHQQAVSAQNIANADTPGYRARELPEFTETLRAAQGGQRATRGGHLNGHPDRTVATAERQDAQDPNGNTVSLELEMIEAVNAKRQHDRALAIYRSNMSVLRASLGKN